MFFVFIVARRQLSFITCTDVIGPDIAVVLVLVVAVVIVLDGAGVMFFPGVLLRMQ